MQLYKIKVTGDPKGRWQNVKSELVQDNIDVTNGIKSEHGFASTDEQIGYIFAKNSEDFRRIMEGRLKEFEETMNILINK